MFASLGIAFALSQTSMLAEAERIASRPMDTAAARRSLEIMDRGDAAARLVVIRAWENQGKDFEAFLRRAWRSVNYEESDLPRQEARNNFRLRILESLSIAAKSETNTISHAALQALLRLSVGDLDLYRDLPGSRCGTTSEGNLTWLAEWTLKDIAKVSDKNLLTFLASPDFQLRVGAADALRERRPTEVRKALAPYLNSRDPFIQVVAAIKLVDDYSDCNRDLVRPLDWNPSEIARSRLARFIRVDKLGGPIQKMSPLERRVHLDSEGATETECRLALSDPDLRVVAIAATNLTEKLDSEEALKVCRRLFESDDLRNFVDAVTLAWKRLGPRRAIELALQAPPKVRIHILDFLPDMRDDAEERADPTLSVPDQFESMPELLSSFEAMKDFPEPFEWDNHTFAEWMPTLQALLEMKNPEARKFAAFGIAECFFKPSMLVEGSVLTMIGTLIDDRDPSVAEKVPLLNRLPAPLKKHFYDTAVPRMPEAVRLDFLRHLWEDTSGIADAILDRYSTSRNPREVEVAQAVRAARTKTPYRERRD